MKRNLDLVRNILLQVEKSEDYLELTDLFEARDRIKDCEFTNNEIIYHVELLIAHGFIDGKLKRDMNGYVIDSCINGLTWEFWSSVDLTGNQTITRFQSLQGGFGAVSI